MIIDQALAAQQNTWNNLEAQSMDAKGARNLMEKEAEAAKQEADEVKRQRREERKRKKSRDLKKTLNI
jgi:hypothetical protein